MSKFWGMKTGAAFIVVCMTVALTVAGCDRLHRNGAEGKKYIPGALGGPYELVLVADHAEWDGAVGDTLRSIFYDRFPNVNREETTVDVLRTLPSGFKKLTARHANVLIVDVDEQYTGPTLELFYDVYAQPQTVIAAHAPDQGSMLELIDSNRDEIILLIEKAERDRDVADAAAHTPDDIKVLMKEKFGFEIGMGAGYKVQSESENFLWLANKMATTDQGIVIYTYPFSGLKDFDAENLLGRRDEFVSRIPGEIPNSHMISDPEYVDLIYKKIDGRQWAEMHGMWKVKGDFMGGPYTNYSTLDAPNQRVIAIDFYVFSPDPKQSQRNFIRQLEHYLYTVNIPNTPLWATESE